MEELGWRENYGIETIGIEDSEENIIDERQVLKICKNYVKGLCNGTKSPENLEVEVNQEVDADENGPYILYSELEKAIKEMKDKKATGDDMLGDVLRLF